MGGTGRGGLIGWRKRLAAGILLLAADLWLVSCGTGVKPEEEAVTTVDGVQLAKGYGIFSAGQAPVYILKEMPAELETDGAKAKLLSCVYQDGVFRFLVELKDYSITEIPSKEAEVSPEQLEESIKTHGVFGPVLPDRDYFPIDRESGVYGRSSFELRAGYRSEDPDVPGEYSKDYYANSITGAGVPGGSFSVETTGSIRDYKGFLNQGYVTTYFWYYTDEMKLETPGPKGAYQIAVPGFEEPFSIEFEQAEVYPSAESIPGMVVNKGFGMMAMGEQTEEGLQVTLYTWTEENRGFSPEISGLICESGGQKEHGTYIRHQSNRNYYGSTREFNQRMEGSETATYYYEISEAFANGEFFLECRKSTVNFRDQSRWTTIPVPQTAGERIELDQTLELESCAIHLRSVEKMEGERTYGLLSDGITEDNRPYVYLEAGTELKGDRFLRLNSIRSVQEEEDPANPGRGRFAHGVYSGGGLTGLYAYCEEGGQEIRLRFENPGYNWYEPFRIPVQI